jgi:hypothetical protein
MEHKPSWLSVNIGVDQANWDSFPIMNHHIARKKKCQGLKKLDLFFKLVVILSGYRRFQEWVSDPSIECCQAI